MLHNSLKKKEWKCSLLKEWITEKSEFWVKLEWILSENIYFHSFWSDLRDHSKILEWSLKSLQNEWKWTFSVQNHSNFTWNSLFSIIHFFKSEHFHSFFFRENSCSSSLTKQLFKDSNTLSLFLAEIYFHILEIHLERLSQEIWIQWKVLCRFMGLTIHNRLVLF